METQDHQETVSTEEIRAILRDVAMLQKEAKEQDVRRQKEYEEWKKECEQCQEKYDEWTRELDQCVDGRMEMEDIFSTPWSKLVDRLVEGELASLLQAHGFDVYATSTRLRGVRDGEQYEFDIVASTIDETIVVKVASMLEMEEMEHFQGQLERILSFMPECKEQPIYGAVAYLRADERADRYAQRQGLFVIRATGKSARIVNEEGFKPKRFN